MSNNYILGSLILLPLYKETSFTWRCDGRSLSINDNSTLFSLIGTSYGGDGVSSFALPDLTDKVPASGLYWHIVHTGIYPQKP